ncbi:MerR family transcriptional regulator [Oceanobacillus jeddahense]|uniref:MerR family transcriptional regulator n=1 Tax=Oceanobacillus jeddahense TaxID=1462527 RepID=A0ABY5JTP5_9BACI|nr:MerR family transcriptional regulator [Oceanobacillus jeddahense]UUI03645.1 MerR family transcriptional regulator [Oceanobacillus jeddahense]
MPNYWSTGQLAALTGLSIRTLRYYDQIGLFSPSLYTEAGHRRYTSEDMQLLLQILVLKRMHLPLEEIKEMVRAGNENLLDTLDQQISRVKAEIAVQEKLLSQLERTKQEAAKTENISFQELTSLFELIRLNRSDYFTNQQLDKMREHYRNTSDKALKQGEERFKELLEELKDKHEKGVSPQDKSVQNLAKEWQKLMETFSDGNQGLIKSAEKFYAENPQPALHYGLDGALYRYIQAALERFMM